MNVRFIAADPRNRARPDLDQVLDHGTDQLAIACAFLTPGGVELLRRHSSRLALPDSFVVVAWEPPTSLEALNELHAVMSGNLYVHLGSKTPVERGGGSGMPGMRGIMHSKVFFAKNQRQCRLWTGSHNLTASATQGANCEAALLVEGDVGEQVFMDALEHLQQCKAEAIPYDPLNPPPPLDPEPTLVIHAECRVALRNSPWFVHFRPSSTDYDKVMRPPVAVWLYLYDPGSLRIGQQRPPATAAYSGTLTALNFTENHPKYLGISADWRQADYVIEVERGIPCLMNSSPHTITPSQGVLKVEAVENSQVVWFTESPVPKLDFVVGERRKSQIDPEFERYFTKQSLSKNGLLHQEYRSVRYASRIPRKELGSMEALHLEWQSKLPVSTEFIIDEVLDQDEKFSFVYLAKYRA